VLIADLALRPEAKALVETYSTGSPRAIFQKTDVCEWLQLERMFEVAEREFGEIDIVCPGAGVYEPVSVTKGRGARHVYRTTTKSTTCC
jgi:NAD(P)-dependent dehydrogenase (short-subunit alcohol dehydrogenase family)